MNKSRRFFLRGSAFLSASALVGTKATAQHEHHQPKQEEQKATTTQANKPASQAAIQSAPGVPVPVHTPDIPKLPYKLENGVKVFHLIAEPVRTEFLPASKWGAARIVDAWGYNGSIPGPTIEVNEGDRVRIIFHNKLPEPTTPHWHGLEVPIEMDGTPAISQPLIMPGETFTYEFTLNQHGTFFYHSHMAMQEMMGMIGFFIIHPRKPHHPRVDKDFGLILQEWAILPNNTIPNTLSMEFNWLTFNGKSGPAATPLIVKQGERVRIRLVNMGMDHHPIHLHGAQFYVTGTEGGRIPESGWYPGNTVLVGVAQARDIEFVAQYTGDWMLHCHLPHHMMNQMVSMVGPMAHMGHGTHTGLGMEEGMGMIRKGNALSEELGPGFGRGMGMAARERETSNLAGQQGAYVCPMHPEVRSNKPGTCPKCGMALAPAQKDNKRVPGYPQDMWMTMDEAVVKPETYGMAPGWTGATMGMMTYVRVLPPDMYEKVMAMVREGRTEPPQKQPEHKHNEK
ncbi:MAG TPA: multicopper oxidase domain-containing protein [Blastocatellia bacterium]|nr:multicopper oxidase domain-containing protein [Blastocatellia bacterium]